MFTVQNFVITSLHCWRGQLNKFWLAFYHLQDIRKVYMKFDNNWANSFGDYPPNKNVQNGKPIFSYSRIMNNSKNMKLPKILINSIITTLP